MPILCFQLTRLSLDYFSFAEHRNMKYRLDNEALSVASRQCHWNILYCHYKIARPIHVFALGKYTALLERSNDAAYVLQTWS